MRNLGFGGLNPSPPSVESTVELSVILTATKNTSASIGKREVLSNSQGQRLKFKVTEVKKQIWPQFERFWTNSSLNSQMALK